MINKCACGCNPQPGKLNINSKLNKDFNKVIQSPNQSELNKQLLIQQLNDKPGNMCVGGSGNQLASDLILEQLKEIVKNLNINQNDISSLEQVVLDLNNKFASFSSLKFKLVVELPTTDISSNIIYLKIINDGSDFNKFEEWIFINDHWEMIGSSDFGFDEAAPHIGDSAPTNKLVWLYTGDDENTTSEIKSNFINYEEELIISNDQEEEILIKED